MSHPSAQGSAWERRGTEQPYGPAATAPLNRPGEPRPVLSRSFSSTTGYLANRRNAGGSSSQPQISSSQEYSRSAPSTPLDSTLSAHMDLRYEPFSSSCPPAVSSGVGADDTNPRPNSQPSRICLSMSLDGRAEITQASSSPPRPNNPQGEGRGTEAAPVETVVLPPLQLPDGASVSRNPRRSLPGAPSAHHTSQNPALPMNRDRRVSLNYLVDPISRPALLRRCRSSDVQAWEDCASSESREDPLIRQAKHESSGSAVAAISLVRSTSSTSSSALKPRSTNMKRRAPVQSGVAKRYKTDKPASGRFRTDTALAPIQKQNIKTRAVEEYLGGAKPSSGTSTGFWNTDSDKENWSPDEDGNPRPFRRTATTASTNGRRPLPSGPPSTAARLDANRNPRRTSAQVSRTTSLQRGNTSPGSWASYSKRYRPKPSLQQSLSQSALEIYEDFEERGDEEEEDDDEDDDDDGGRGDAAAACKDLLSMCGVSPSKEKDVAAATGLLSLKWGR